jgi:hypothetical protein
MKTKTYDVVIEAIVRKTIRVNAIDENAASDLAHEMFTVDLDDTEDSYEENTLDIHGVTMAKYKVKATQYVYWDAYIEADSPEEAYQKAKQDDTEWVLYEQAGDWEIYSDVFEEADDEEV